MSRQREGGLTRWGTIEFEPVSTFRPTVMGSKYVVASGHYLASAAGARVLEQGGNVVDAGVAAGLCINVLQPDMTSLGGVAPIILRLKSMPEVVTISGLGRWPQGVSLEALRRHDGGVLPGMLTAVVPAALGAWVEALDRYGTMSFGEVAASAIELAERGFPVNRFLASNLARIAERLERWPSSREVFLREGRPPRMGERLVQADLGRTLRMLAEAESGRTSRHAGLDAVRALFYEGELAARMAAFCQELGGYLTRDDFRVFRVGVEPPVRTTYRGFDVYACGFWCQGPVVLQALNIIEGYEIAEGGPRTLHLITEALKASFADRHAYYGDPDFVRVPMKGLLAKEYAATWRSRIRESQAFPEMPEPGDAWQYEGRSGRPARAAALAAPGPEPPDTSYVGVVDSDGNAFSATPSDGLLDTPLVPGLGLIISARGNQSWLEAEHPSSVAPGKRPRLTPSPGLVQKDDRVFMAYGTPGLDVQPQAMVQLVVNLVDHGMDVQEAIEAPRLATYSFPVSSLPHSYNPGLLCVEARVPPEVRDELARRGHRVEAWPEWTPKAGALCAVTVDPDGHVLKGGADPRRLAYAVGW